MKFPAYISDNFDELVKSGIFVIDTKEKSRWKRKDNLDLKSVFRDFYLHDIPRMYENSITTSGDTTNYVVIDGEIPKIRYYGFDFSVNQGLSY